MGGEEFLWVANNWVTKQSWINRLFHTNNTQIVLFCKKLKPDSLKLVSSVINMSSLLNGKDDPAFSKWTKNSTVTKLGTRI